MSRADRTVSLDLIVFTVATGLNAEMAINTVRIPTYEAFARHLRGKGKVLVVTHYIALLPDCLTWPISSSKRLLRPRLQRKLDNLWVYAPILPLPLGALGALPAVREVLRRCLGSMVRSATQRIGMNNAHRIVTVNDPFHHHLLGLVGESLVVYDCLDEYSLYGGSDEPDLESLRNERKLVHKADIVFTTSRALYDKMRAQHGHVYYFPNATDFDFFNRATHDCTPISPALARIPRPIIGFMGALCRWYDYALLRSVIKARPTWSFVFIGWTDSLPDIAAMRRMPNVYFLGTQNYEDLPSFLKGFDVAIMPYKLNAAAKAVNPDKMYQYMAGGVPVVATPTPEIAQYAEAIDVADNAEDFILAMEQRLAKGRQDGRLRKGIAIARENTWDKRTEEELKVMETRLQDMG